MKTKIIVFTLALAASTCLLTAQDTKSTSGAQPPAGGPGGQRPRNLIIEAIDLNKDGTIDADELAKAGESLKKFDKNGDGKLTQDELRPQQRPGGGGGGGKAGAGRPQRTAR